MQMKFNRYLYNKHFRIWSYESSFVFSLYNKG